jgi:hypothetical protein
MKKDVLLMLGGEISSKRPSKETLNHPGIIQLASGHDPYNETSIAYLKAYESLGIDIINRVPERNAPRPMKPGKTGWLDDSYKKAYLGLYDTYIRVKYPFENVKEFFNSKEIKLDYNELITPVPHSLDEKTINRKMSLVDGIGIYYYQYYTTLFMWGVEYLGWEVFLEAVALDPKGYKDMFLDIAFEETLKGIKLLIDIDCPFVFCHDDIVDANGPICNPKWYDDYIFPRYEELWKPIKKAGKKIIFVADGNMELFLKTLVELGVDGVMFENPATNFDLILKYFNDKIIIGGVETNILANGTPDLIKKHVMKIYEKTKDLPGFVMSTPGSITGDIPIQNLEAYFDERVKVGFTLEGWRKRLIKNF